MASSLSGLAMTSNTLEGDHKNPKVNNLLKIGRYVMAILKPL
jgi:hypothetical protein